MNLKHQCLFCGSPCELTLAATSEGCSNEKCRAFAAPPVEVKKDIHTRNAEQAWSTPMLPPAIDDPAPYSPCPRCEAYSRKTGRPQVCALHQRIQSTDFNTTTQQQTAELMKVGRQLGEAMAGFFDEDRMHFPTLDELVSAAGLPIGELFNIKATQTGRMKSGVDQRRYDVLGRPLSPRSAAKRIGFTDAAGLFGVPNHCFVDFNGLSHAEVYELTEKYKEALPRLRIEFYIAKRLRWPHTMRVVDREMVGNANKEVGPTKDSNPLLGVLALVDVPRESDGRTAIYEYISVVTPVSARGRVTIVENAVAIKPSRKYHSEHYLGVMKAYRNNKDAYALEDVHLPAILEEFELDRARDRAARAPSEAEIEMFKALRSA